MDMKAIATLTGLKQKQVEDIVIALRERNVSDEQIEAVTKGVAGLVASGQSIKDAIQSFSTQQQKKQVGEGVGNAGAGLTQIGDRAFEKARQSGEMMGVKMKAVALTTAAQVASGSIEPTDPEIKRLNDAIEESFFGSLDSATESVNPLLFLAEVQQTQQRLQLNSAPESVETYAETLT